MTPPSRGKIWGFRAAALLMGVGALALAELGARLAGLAPLPPPLLPEVTSPQHRAVTSSGFARYLVPGEDGLIHTAQEAVTQRFLHDLAFTPRPAPGRLRIVCFGGSATLGVPNEDQPELAFPGRLGAHLREWGFDVEVLNLGGASFGSRQVVELAEEVSAYAPDVFVVYSGNNEFFQYNLELHQANQAHLVFASRLEQLHLVRLGRRMILGGSGRELGGLVALDPAALRARQDGVTASLMSRSWEADPGSLPTRDAEGRYHRQDVHARQVAEAYEANLRAVAAHAAAGIQVVGVSVPANLRHPPGLSLHAPGLGPLGTRRYGGAFEDATARGREGDWDGAIEALEDAVAIDPLYALGWYRLGQSRLKAGEGDAARDALLNALELDMNPGRPPQSLGDALTRVAADTPLVAIDGTGPFMALGRAPLGEGLFSDSCHLTPTGYDRLALEIATGLLALWSETPPGAAP